MAEKSLFDRLGRLFSNDVIIRSDGGKRLKVVDTGKIQTSGKYTTNSLIDRFNRLYVYNKTNVYNPNLNYQTLRIQMYTDYEAMDADAIIGSALDILADEATLKNDMGEVLSIKSSDEQLQKVLYNLFYDVLNIEFNLWSWIRGMVKFGDFFLKLEISEEYGIYNVLPYTVYHVIRKEGEDESNPIAVSFSIDPDGIAASQGPMSSSHLNKNTIQLENYEVAHFRLLSDSSFLPYGRSYLEPARKLFKQLSLMEDAALIHRIMRAPEKRMFYVNVGSLPPNEVDQYMQKAMDSIKKTPYVDNETGDYNLKFNMQNMMEDFYIPVRGNDTTTRIETTKGLEYDGMQDIEYLRAKLFAALKIPKAYFGFEGELNGKATLAAEDIRFARTIERIQRIVESELIKIALVHLYSQGYDGESLTNFSLKLTTPSIIYEQEKVALLQEKINLAEQMRDSRLFPSDYIYDHIFNLSEDEYNQMRDLIKEDAKRTFVLDQIANEGNDPEKSGRSYGTPHDLASLYGPTGEGNRPGAFNSQPEGTVPPGYEDFPEPPKYGEPGEEGGRPKERMSITNTQEDPLGRDRVGKHDMKGGYPGDDPLRENSKATKTVLLRNKDLIKKLVFEVRQDEDFDILNEKNIKNLNK